MKDFSSLPNKTAAYLKQSALARALVRAALVCSICLCCNTHATAQSPCFNPVDPTAMVRDFNLWLWYLPSNDLRNCAIWTMRTNNGMSLVTPPWIGPVNGELYRINLTQDYTPANGWELLRMNMGARGAIRIPYFFLYNKYRGIIRTFFYARDLGASPNGINIVMSHTTAANGNRNSGILALSQPLLQSQDYYLNNQSINNEFITYKPAFTTGDGWIFADFPVGFDSYAGSARYNSTALQFSVLATTTSVVNLDGASNFQTNQTVPAGGYGIGGTAPNAASGLNNFAIKGQKVLKAFDYDDLTKFKSGFTDKASKTAATVPIPPVPAQQASLSNAVANGSSQSGIFKKVLGIAGSASAALGIISTVIGVLWPEETAGPAFIPTTSTGTLALKGSISTTIPLTSTTMQIPGGQHSLPIANPDGGNQPYYDCPLGIFNIKNTPQLNKFPFTFLDGYSGGCPDNPEPDCGANYTQYDSYQVTNDLIAIYNDAAGLKLESVQAAIVTEIPTATFKFVGVYYPSYNLLREKVFSGEVEVISANDSLVVCATPFVDLGTLKNQALTTAAGAKVYIRIKAILQRKGASLDTPPIFFVQDYAIQANSSLAVAATNPRFTGDPHSAETPYSNLASRLIFVPNPTGSPYQDPFTLTNPYVVPVGNYTSPLILSVPTTIIAGASPLSSVRGNVVINHPTTAATSLFLSNTSIALGPGFSVTPGTNFVAATPLQAWRRGGPALIEPFIGPCSYNSTTQYNPVAYRGGKPGGAADTGGPAVTTDALTVSPNPTDGLVTIATAVAGETGAVVVVSDYMGKEVQRIETIPAGLSNQQINLAGKAGGLYLVRLITGKGTVTQKVLLQ